MNFESLHNVKPIVEEFADGTFRIFVTFLYSGITKVAGRLKVEIKDFSSFEKHLDE